MRKLICILLVCSSLPLVMTAQNAASGIRLNQIGFYPGAPKVAVITDNSEGDFLVKSVTSGEIAVSYTHLTLPTNREV